jgi:hypothetical protein
MLTYYIDDVKTKRLDNPEVWQQVTDNPPSTKFRSYPYFSEIPTDQNDPVRFGPFVIDIDNGLESLKDALKIIAFFEQTYNVETDQWSIFLSGKKGVHLELSEKVFDMENGHRLLPLGYKRLAKEIEGELSLKLDTSMYNRGSGKPYRQPNVMRGNGLYKVQIEYENLFEIIDQSEYDEM